MPGKIRDTGHLLEIIDSLNAHGLTDGVALVSFDVINMFPNIYNETGLNMLKSAFESRVRKPSKAFESVYIITIQPSQMNTYYKLTALRLVPQIRVLIQIWLYYSLTRLFSRTETRRLANCCSLDDIAMIVCRYG